MGKRKELQHFDTSVASLSLHIYHRFSHIPFSFRFFVVVVVPFSEDVIIISLLLLFHPTDISVFVVELKKKTIHKWLLVKMYVPFRALSNVSFSGTRIFAHCLSNR